MDWDDAERVLRRALAELRGWPFERFLELARREHVEMRAGDSDRYLLDVYVLDRSGDQDPKDERLELELTLTEQAPEPRERCSLWTEASLRRGETFSGEAGELVRRTARAKGRAQLVWLGLALALAAVLMRCAHRLP